MDASGLQSVIDRDIRRVSYPDRIELYLPFFFTGAEDAPLCLTWTQDGVLSDGGRTMLELKKRLGDLSPYQENIRNILNHAAVTLVGGQKLVVRQPQTRIFQGECSLDYCGSVSHLLQVMTLLGLVDTVTVDEDGAVRV